MRIVNVIIDGECRQKGNDAVPLEIRVLETVDISSSLRVQKRHKEPKISVSQFSISQFLL